MNGSALFWYGDIKDETPGDDGNLSKRKMKAVVQEMLAAVTSLGDVVRGVIRQLHGDRV